MTVAFIGSVNYPRTPILIMKMWEILLKLIKYEDANIFLFANAGKLDSDCFTMVSQLKERYSNIERHYHHGVFDYDVGYVSHMKEIYDEVHFPPKEHPLSRDLRNREMIDKCDVLVTYCNPNDQETAYHENVLNAMKYAREKNKRIINLFEEKL